MENLCVLLVNFKCSQFVLFVSQFKWPTVQATLVNFLIMWIQFCVKSLFAIIALEIDFCIMLLALKCMHQCR